MSFDTFADFLAMGGHGLYVWSSFALGAVILIGNLVLPLLARKRLQADLLRRLRREESGT